MSAESTSTAGVLLLTLAAVAWGGSFLLRVQSGREETTAFQAASYRAGHAHAGVLVLLALVVQPYADAIALEGGWARLARSGVGVAAVLMPAGFFLGAMGRGRTSPSRWRLLVAGGGVVLVAAVVTLGVGLLRA